MIVVLDSGPLGLISNPRSDEGHACGAWLREVLRGGAHRVAIPEIADYEVRRELIRARKLRGLRRLDELRRTFDFLPITTSAMLMAAELWAQARQAGRPTAAEAALDGDVILAAQVRVLQTPDTIVATANVRHLSRFTPAARWTDIGLLP